MDIIRSFSDYENPPTEEEAPGADSEPEWERCIGENQVLVRGPNWGSGMKGHWIQLLAGASLVCTLMQNWLV